MYKFHGIRMRKMKMMFYLLSIFIDATKYTAVRLPRPSRPPSLFCRKVQLTEERDS